MFSGFFSFLIPFKSFSPYLQHNGFLMLPLLLA